MKKQDITQTIVTINVTERKDEVITKTSFDINLQEWIKKSIEEQDELVKSKYPEGIISWSF